MNYFNLSFYEGIIFLTCAPLVWLTQEYRLPELALIFAKWHLGSLIQYAHLILNPAYVFTQTPTFVFMIGSQFIKQNYIFYL